MNEDAERQEIEKLLPWYVTGRLGRAETSKVESYLGQHPDVLAQLDLIRAERQKGGIGSSKLAVRKNMVASICGAEAFDPFRDFRLGRCDIQSAARAGKAAEMNEVP